jgi:hypothetical protein
VTPNRFMNSIDTTRDVSVSMKADLGQVEREERTTRIK